MLLCTAKSHTFTIARGIMIKLHIATFVFNSLTVVIKIRIYFLA